MSSDTGTVLTVEGAIAPEELGVVIPHEHLFIDLIEAWFDAPASAVDRARSREPVSLSNLSFLRRNPLDNRDNGRLDSVDEAIDELSKYHRAGGDTLVDVTPKNVGSDPQRVRAVGRATGVTVIHGTAYYTRAAHPDRITHASVEALADEFISDIRHGIDDTSVRAGMVGELGVSGQIHDQEEKVLRAGARAAAQTGAPLNVHPNGRRPEAHQDYTYPSSRWALDILDILEEEGLPPERVVFSHMDRTRFELEPSSLEYQYELADRGAYLEYDLWGTDFFNERFQNGWPSDPERIDAVTDLIERGYTENLLFSHDICMKIQRQQYGGFGYAHLLRNIHDMLQHHGVPTATFNTITKENPRRMLTFSKPI